MKAQKWLNAFVRFVALLEWVGNVFGTVDFIWATVVVLGGFITNLVGKDFGFATAIVFLEAFKYSSPLHACINHRGYRPYISQIILLLSTTSLYFQCSVMLKIQ